MGVIGLGGQGAPGVTGWRGGLARAGRTDLSGVGGPGIDSPE